MNSSESEIPDKATTRKLLLLAVTLFSIGFLFLYGFMAIYALGFDSTPETWSGVIAMTVASSISCVAIAYNWKLPKI